VSRIWWTKAKLYVFVDILVGKCTSDVCVLVQDLRNWTLKVFFIEQHHVEEHFEANEYSKRN
jgi:hypothetical protein